MKKINKTTANDFLNSNQHAMVKSVETTSLYSFCKDTGETFCKAKATIWLKTSDLKRVAATMYFRIPLDMPCEALENYITSNLCYYYPGDFNSSKGYLQAVFDGTCMLIEDRARVA